jgi:SsrA-binding protein
MAAEKEKPNYKVVADNRRARYDYEIGETFEAGLMLTGTEVKSLRTGKATVAESYAAVDRSGELILYNANIPEYLQANRFNHEPKRPRKLLLHAKEIAKLAKGVEREGMTIVALRIYFNAKGRAKIAIALGRGKKLHDKRETEKVRDWNRDKSRLMRERGWRPQPCPERRRRIIYPSRSEDDVRAAETNFKIGGLVAAWPRSNLCSRAGL